MENILLTLNIIFAIILIILILLQKSEGGALGIGVSQESFMFSRTAGNFFTKATAIIATLFIICSLSLTIIGRKDLPTSTSVPISENFKSMNFHYVLPIIGVVLASIIFRSWIQKLLLEEIQVKLSIKDNFLLFLSGLALIISPGGTGQVIKSYFLKEKYGISISKSIPVILFERYYDLISVTALVIISICIIFSFEAFIVSIFF